MPEHPKEYWKGCTNGEKCLTIHIALTLLAIFFMGVVYLTHYVTIHRNVSQNGRRHLNIFGNNKAEGDMQPSIQDFPFMAAVILNGTSPNFMCNAVLITGRWCLTSAHCVAVRDSPLLESLLHLWFIKFGVSDWKEAGHTTEVSEAKVHPEFDAVHLKNNIGLLKHRFSVSFTVSIQPISLAHEHLSYYQMQKKPALLTGWGKMSAEFDMAQRQIGTMFVQLIHNDECNDKIRSIRTLENGEFCVVTESQSIRRCHPEIGSALLIDNALVGLANWGEKCPGTTSIPLIFIEIAPQLEWIYGSI